MATRPGKGRVPDDSELSRSDDDDGVGRVRESEANELPEGLAFLRQGCSRYPAPAAELSGRSFQFQELQFPVEAGSVAGEASVSAYYPVAGNDDGDWVVSHCIAHSLG